MKDIISTPRSPKAIGPYSQAIRANGFIFVSGQLPIDPASGQLAKGGATVQAKVVFENLKAIVEAGSFSPAILRGIFCTHRLHTKGSAG